METYELEITKAEAYMMYAALEVLADDPEAISGREWVAGALALKLKAAKMAFENVVRKTEVAK